MPENTPGIGTALSAEDKQLWFFGRNQEVGLTDIKVEIGSTAVDSGNTPTTTLRAGLIMGIKTSDGLAYAYDPDATDGTQNAVGILPKYVNMLKDGTATQRVARLFTQGRFRYDELIGADAAALSMLWDQGCQVFPSGQFAGMPPWAFTHVKRQLYPTVGSGTTTLTAAMSGYQLLFNEAVATGSGIVLPTIAKGLVFEIIQQGDFDTIITAAANTIMWGDASGGPSTTLTFSTTNKKPAHVILEAVYGTPGGTLALFWKPSVLAGTAVSA